MKNLNILSIISILFFATACNEHGYTEFDEKTFETERAKWLDMQISDYQFHVNYFSDAGPEEAIVSVKNTKVQSIGLIPEMPNESIERRFNSITAVYDDIVAAFMEHSKQINKSEIEDVTIRIKYNAKYHYPEEVHYSVGYEGDMYGGYYYTLKISDFKLL